MQLSTVLSLVTNLFADDSPFGASQRAKLMALLAEKPDIPGVIARLISALKLECWVSSNITDENFPTLAQPSLDGVQLNEIIGSRRAVLAELARLGRRPAFAAEGLLYGSEHLGVPRDGLVRVWCLGQSLACPDELERFVLVALDVDGCSIRLESTDDVRESEYVLSFPMTTQKLAA